MSREYFINADFDLSWRRLPEDYRPGLSSRLEEYAWHFLWAGGPENSVILEQPLPDQYLEHLHRMGIAPCQSVISPQRTASAQCTPFGWNPASMAWNAGYERPARHPSLEVVRRVNARSFAWNLEAELGQALSSSILETAPSLKGGLFQELEPLDAYLKIHGSSHARWVIKPGFGNAAMGSWRVAGSGLTDNDKKLLDKALRENDEVVLEPWLERIEDRAILFELDESSQVQRLRTHALENTDAGAFLGMEPLDWEEAFGEQAGALTVWTNSVASAMHAQGYFGPVGLDLFRYRYAQGKSRWRLLSDINARLSMAWPVHDYLEREIGAGMGVCSWRLFSTRNHRLPVDYLAWNEWLDSDAFDPNTRMGILPTTPLHVFRQGAWVKPYRIGVLCAAPHRRELRDLIARFETKLAPLRHRGGPRASVPGAQSASTTSDSDTIE